MDCGPACLRMISHYYGKKYTLKTLVDNSFYTRKGVSLKSISYTAEELGFKTIGINTSYEYGLFQANIDSIKNILFYKEDIKYYIAYSSINLPIILNINSLQRMFRRLSIIFALYSIGY